MSCLCIDFCWVGWIRDPFCRLKVDVRPFCSDGFYMMLSCLIVYDSIVMSESMPGSIIYSSMFLKVELCFVFSYMFPVFSLENSQVCSQKSAFWEVYETTWSSRPSLRMSRCPTWSRDVERVSRFTSTKTLCRMVCQKWWLWRFWKDRDPNWKFWHQKTWSCFWWSLQMTNQHPKLTSKSTPNKSFHQINPTISTKNTSFHPNFGQISSN